VNRQKALAKQRRRRQRSVRSRLSGTPERPRLAVFRSLKHVYAQIIDDAAAKTLAAVSSRELADDVAYGGNCKAAAIVGKKLAEKALAAGVKQVQFDRRYYKYHGRVKSLADAAREGGLKF